MEERNNSYYESESLSPFLEEFAWETESGLSQQARASEQNTSPFLEAELEEDFFRLPSFGRKRRKKSISPARSRATKINPQQADYPSGRKPSKEANYWEDFRHRLACLAEKEWIKWDQGNLKETKDKAKAYITKYFISAGMSPNKGAELAENGTAWSAAFISHMMELAGAGNKFKYAIGHHAYMKEAKFNRQNNRSNPFRLYDLAEAKPEVGDLICLYRGCFAMTYQNIEQADWQKKCPDGYTRETSAHCDIIVKVEEDKVWVIGGNTSDYRGLKKNTCGKKSIRLNGQGYFSKQNKRFALLKIKTDLGVPAPSGIQYQNCDGQSITTAGSASIYKQAAPPIDRPANLSFAVRQNQKWSQRLGWDEYYQQINDFLLPIMGLEAMSMSPVNFAEAVKLWQAQSGFRGKDVDGIIGPKTWRKLKRAIGIAQELWREETLSEEEELAKHLREEDAFELDELEYEAYATEPTEDAAMEDQIASELEEELDEYELIDEWVDWELEEEELAPQKKGTSRFAIQSTKTWERHGDLRSAAYRNQIYGLIVHTTGGSLPGKAVAAGIYPAQMAIDYYTRASSKGTHYVNGWGGYAGNDLSQIANEKYKANGVGMGKQRKSIQAGRFAQDLNPNVVRLWRQRWPQYRYPTRLLPAHPNTCCVHMECTPLLYYQNGKSYWAEGYEPLREDIRFTQAQHESVVMLACDMALRYGWDQEPNWWRSPRLLGHEDLSPISRHDRRGGWDPGGLRDKPYFDWEYVYQRIAEIVADDYREIRNATFVPSSSAKPAPRQTASSFTRQGVRPSEPAQVVVSSFARAVRLNAKYARRLGWERYYDEINQLLLPYLGLQNMSLSPEAFAEGIQLYQRDKGFRGKDADGILGPKTWRRLRRDLGV